MSTITPTTAATERAAPMTRVAARVLSAALLTAVAVSSAGCAAGALGAGSTAEPAGAPQTATIPASLQAVAKGSGDQPVCEGPREQIGIVVQRSRSEIALVKRYTPAIVAQAERLALSSCGALVLGIVGPRPSQTVLTTIAYTPTKLHAVNATPVRRLMTQDAAPTIGAFTAQVKALTAAGSSPVFTIAERVHNELVERDVHLTRLVLVGDGMVVDRGLDARYGRLPAKTLNAFAAQLHGLPCTMLLGAGMGSKLPDGQIHRSLQALHYAWKQAGSTLLTSPGKQLLPCPATSGAVGS